MKKVFIFFALVLVYSCNNNKNQLMVSENITGFEKNSNTTPTYHEVIKFYEELAKSSSNAQLLTEGDTDAGYPLHTLIIDKPSNTGNKLTLLINNGIHPGEPCGIDASMMVARDLLQKPEYSEILESLRVVIIPFYNIGGGLNRSSHSRANQIGPDAYGFRGNAKNLDLNRDFVKCDSKNAQTFNTIFNKYNPHIFIDTHTSNGADYQYVMTLIATQKDKLAPELSKVLTESMLPYLYKEMDKVGYEMTPYVYAKEKPDDGIYGFLDLPRYSSGYAAMHHCISFMPETHMLKPYKDRVLSTYHFILSSLTYASINNESIVLAKDNAIENYIKEPNLIINWELDTEKIDTILFKGYEASYKISEVTGQERLYYDRKKPFEKEIQHFNNYKAKSTIKKPKSYIIPKAYDGVIDILKNNGVLISRLDQDTMIRANFYEIISFKDQKAYEGHYLHYDVNVADTLIQVPFYKGDYVINTDQDKARYIVETLEPEAPDSFFAWNFFDGILMQKEYFSAYVFEDLALEILENDKKLKQRFIEKKKEDKKFAIDAKAQLDFIYKSSPHFEKTFMRYPIARVF